MVRSLLAKDVMTKNPPTLTPEVSVKEAATLFVEQHIEAAPVVSEGRLVGIVSDTDLIMQEVKLHFPTYIQFLEGYLYLGGLPRFENELRKAVAARVEDVMTSPVITAKEDTSMGEIATLMEDKHFDSIPVVDDAGTLIGTVSKTDIIRALAAG